MQDNNSQQDTDAWSIYWQDNHLRSCCPSADPQLLAQIDSIWEKLAIKLAPDSKVLDLATGNGAVPAALASANRYINITAVDLADISPMVIASNIEIKNRINFIGNTDISNLPFTSDSFDIATSQFGFEYSDTHKTSEELHRVLKPGGQFLFLIHHAQSVISNSTSIKIFEINYLFKKFGLIQLLDKILQSGISQEEIDYFLLNVQKSHHQKTSEVTGQVLHAAQTIFNLSKTDDNTCLQLAKTLRVRLTADYLRLTQMRKSALSPSQLSHLVDNLTQLGFEIEEASPYTLKNRKSALIGWQLAGIKK